MTRWAPRAAVAALGAILVITALWWALALWPMPEAPAWMLRTREVCFGSPATGLPTAGGWILLIGEPIGMVTILMAIAGGELRAELARLAATAGGRWVFGLIGAAVLVGLGSVARRVAADQELGPSVGRGGVTRIDLAAPSLSLLDQFGNRRDLAEFRGRPVLVGFAFAHCETVCPGIVRNLIAVGREVPGVIVLIVTVDPWRDPPSRLASIASQWALGERAFVVSGTVDEVRAVLAAWGVASTPDPRTGDVVHPATVRVIGPDGRVKAIVSGDDRDALRRALMSDR